MPRVRGNEETLARHFELLSTAVADCRTVRMGYYASSTDEVTSRDPYHLRLEAGAWYLIGPATSAGSCASSRWTASGSLP